MATIGDNLPVPQNKIEESYVWREWFQKLRNRLVSMPVGVSGTFISADSTPKTITVVNGIITSIV
jgi:hypothetical protein